MDREFEAYYNCRVVFHGRDMIPQYMEKAIQDYGGKAVRNLSVVEKEENEFFVSFVEVTEDYYEPTASVAEIIVDGGLGDVGIDFDEYTFELIDFDYKEKDNFDEY